MEEKTVLINNLRANFKVAGKGPAILILHGWGGSSSSWIRVQEILAKKGYRVICPDFPGFGKSRTPKKAWSVTDYVNWTIGFAESQNLETFIVVAHSFGSRVGIKLAVGHPEKIEALILCDPAGIKPKPGLKTRIILWLAMIGNMIFAPRFLTRFKDRIRNLFYYFLRNRDYVKANGVMKEILKKVIQEDLLSYLPKITTRTLIVWGKKDRMLPIEYAHIFKERIRNSRLEILPDTSHSPHLETPDKLVEIILDFLRD